MTFFKAAAAPVLVSTVMVAVQLLWISVPLVWHGAVYSGLWFVFVAAGFSVRW